MNFTLRLGAIVLMLAAGTSLAWAAEPSHNLVVSYRWSNGTVAPSNYQVGEIRIREDGAGEFDISVGTDTTGKKTRHADFEAAPEAFERLVTYIRGGDLDYGPAESATPAQPTAAPGEGLCELHVFVDGQGHTVPCNRRGVTGLLAMVRSMALPVMGQQSPGLGPGWPPLPVTFAGRKLDYIDESILLDEQHRYELTLSRDSILGPGFASASRQQGSWSYDDIHSVVILHPDDAQSPDGSLEFERASQTAHLSVPGFVAMDLHVRPSTASMPRTKSDRAVPTMGRMAIMTRDGHFLSAVSGGGRGGPETGDGAVALRSDATQVGPWERFDWIWLDQGHTRFALRTAKGTYVTAVGGGGMGGPQDPRSPFHTNATAIGPDEIFFPEFDQNGKVALRTRKGFYVTASNGGGYGGPNTTPVHTDAKAIGPWETFGYVIPRE